MPRLIDISEKYDQEIGDILDDLTFLTPLNHLELKDVFSDDELKELQKNLVEVEKATSDNDKIAKLMEQGTAILKLLRKVGLAI